MTESSQLHQNTRRPLLMRDNAFINTPIFERQYSITVGGFAVDDLRVGFTVEKDLELSPNTAEVVIYNLSRSSRDRIHKSAKSSVVIQAGYRMAGSVLLFAGEMREAFSRAEPDGTWATVLRAGDADDALRGKRSRVSFTPGVSVERVFLEQIQAMNLGLGNAMTEITAQLRRGDVDLERAGKALAKGLTVSGSSAEALDKVAKSAGLEVSVQDGQVQVLKKGQVLGTKALVLAPGSGLDGTPEFDGNGTMRCRARLLAGLSPGYPVQVMSSKPMTVYWGEIDGAAPEFMRLGREYIYVENETIYRIEKVRYVGDTHGPDWDAELECRDIKATAEEKKKARRK